MTALWIALAFTIGLAGGLLISWWFMRRLAASLAILTLKRAGVTPQEANRIIDGITGEDIKEEFLTDLLGKHAA